MDAGAGTDGDDAGRERGLAEVLNTLGQDVRLAILRQLREPLALSEIRVTVPDRDGGRPRPLTRQTLTHHVERLVDLGVVRSREAARSWGTTREYVVDHAALFRLAEDVRDLARLRPLAPSLTPTVRGRRGATWSGTGTGLRLVLVGGLDQGRVFPLGEGPSAMAGTWTIGRHRDADVCLDYDPFVSGENSRLHATGDGWELEDVPGSLNGTAVDLEPLPDGGRVPVSPGQLIGVGRSLLLLRA